MPAADNGGISGAGGALFFGIGGATVYHAWGQINIVWEMRLFPLFAQGGFGRASSSGRRRVRNTVC